MQSRKELKKRGKSSFQRHIGLSIFVCLVATYFGIEFIGSITITRIQFLPKINLLSGTRGVFASIIHAITSGMLVDTISSVVHSIVGSNDFYSVLLILGSLLLTFLFWAFFKNTYRVISRRIFLEARTYEKVPIQSFGFLIRTKKWMQASFSILLVSLYYILWCFTIVGAFIKRYSYFLVPYIVAENPSISPRKAIFLSEEMMNGHKWECFLLECSFLPFELLGILTFGLSKVFYSNPYQFATLTEYYCDLRKLAIREKFMFIEELNDPYLYQIAPQKVLNREYESIISSIEKVKIKDGKTWRDKVANLFGISLYRDEEEQDYENMQLITITTKEFKDAIHGKAYPTKLCPIPWKSKKKKIETINYMKRYSIPSLILLFFSFSFIGWIWEVSLHLISDGTFVNRGALHGPWLPIYGWGGTLILVLLYKFRKNPIEEFTYTIVVCGFIEYFTSLYLELTHGGIRWWDYTGYVLNLNGRICAEGLLVFGLGGMAIVYFVAPILDKFFHKWNTKVLTGVALLLLSIFIIDQFYSSKHPNVGEGITEVVIPGEERGEVK